MAEPVRRAGDSAVVIVWRAILQGLYEARFLPGQRLTEAELTREFKVSRSSVREALNRLAAEGVVEIHRHRGATIRSADAGEMFDALELLQVMAGHAARTAALRIADGGNARLAKQALVRVRSTSDGLAGFDLAREQNNFYRTLIQLAGNSELRRLLPRLHMHFLRIELNPHQSIRAIFDDYADILEAILSGNPYDSERAMRAHIGRHMDLLRQLLAERVAASARIAPRRSEQAAGSPETAAGPRAKGPGRATAPKSVRAEPQQTEEMCDDRS